jgi:oligopeptide transport system substrate-binding protein
LQETEEEFPTVIMGDFTLGLTIIVGWDYFSGEETLEEVATTIADSVSSDLENVQVLASNGTTLQDGTPAHSITVTGMETENQLQVRVVVAQRGARVYIAIASAPMRSFEARERTIDAVIGSLSLTALRPYDVDRNTALVLASSEPYDLDPATTESSAAGMLGDLFSGLVTLNTDMQVAPDLAQSWDISADGRTYTFHLHPDAVFHDGRPVTAADFKYSWERAADPKTESQKARTYLGDILGVKEKLDGQADEIAGVVVIDDHTLQVTIDAPKVYFLAKLTWPVAFVVDRSNVERRGIDDWWRTPNGAGPFRLKKWDDDVIILARNDAYYGPIPKLEHIVFLIEAGPTFLLYESGDVDMSGVPSDLVERVQDPADPLHAELHTVPNFCTTRIAFDVSRPPFDDLLVRRAFSYAVDREQIIEVAWNGVVVPAIGPLPPGMPGYSPDLTGYDFNPDQARELLAQSSYGDAANLPPLTFTESGYTEPDPSVAALLQTWEEVFGIQIEVELLEPRSFIYELREHHGHLFMMGWCADYPDPENFLDVLYHSASEENWSGYNNPQVDSLLEQARTERDPAARLALYHQVEQMIVDDAPEIWLSHGVSRQLRKPYVHGYVLTPLGVPQSQFIYLDPH